MKEWRARAIVYERSGRVCEGCGRAPAVEYSHRVGRGQGGPWHPANALHLCGPDGCHLWATHNRTEARSVGWILRSTDDYLTFPALLHGRGLTYLTADGLYVPAPPIEGDAA